MAQELQSRMLGRSGMSPRSFTLRRGPFSGSSVSPPPLEPLFFLCSGPVLAVRAGELDKRIQSPLRHPEQA